MMETRADVAAWLLDLCFTDRHKTLADRYEAWDQGVLINVRILAELRNVPLKNVLICSNCGHSIPVWFRSKTTACYLRDGIETRKNHAYCNSCMVRKEREEKISDVNY